jgi:hypothetical protein
MGNLHETKKSKDDLKLLPVGGLSTADQEAAAKSAKLKDTQMKKRSRKTNQIYQLLIIINVCFFVMVTPLVLSNSLGILMENKILMELVYIMAYSNHSFNFIFYGFSCKMYRVIVWETFFTRPIRI